MSQVYGVEKESHAVRFETTFYVGKREVEVDEDKGNASDGKRKTENEEEGRIGPMLYNRSDSPSILTQPTIW